MEAYSGWKGIGGEAGMKVLDPEALQRGEYRVLGKGDDDLSTAGATDGADAVVGGGDDVVGEIGGADDVAGM